MRKKTIECTVIDETSQSSPLLSKQNKNLESVIVDIEKASKPTTFTIQTAQNSDIVITGHSHLSEDADDGEVIRIITLEDVFEELLQEEIVDETDEFVVAYKRIRVAAAASSMARSPSIRRLKGVGGQNKQGQTPAPNSYNSTRLQGSLAEPLLGKKQ